MKKLLMAALLCLMFVGCSSTRRVYVPVEQWHEHTRSDTARIMQLRIDTVIERDSVALIQRGDTVWLSRTLWREKICELHDTLYVNVRDTVYLTRCESVEVPREFTFTERVKLKTGSVTLALIGLLMLYIVFKVIRRLRTR